MIAYVLIEGTEHHLDALAGSAEGEVLLDLLDERIVSIEAQLRDPERLTDDEWASKARTALRHSKLFRPKLQQRIAELRREERQARHSSDADRAKAQEVIKAFHDAATAILPEQTINSIWAQVRVDQPGLLGDAGLPS